MYSRAKRVACRAPKMITWSKSSRLAPKIQRSAFCQGDRYAVRHGLVPKELMNSTTEALKMESRSKMRNLGAASKGKASRN